MVECPIWVTAFRQAWLDSWGDSSALIENWRDHSTSLDRYHVAKLRFPTTLIESIPPRLQHHIPRQVAKFQHCSMILAPQIRSHLPMPGLGPPEAKRKLGAWYQYYWQRTVIPRVTQKVLGEHAKDLPPSEPPHTKAFFLMKRPS